MAGVFREGIATARKMMAGDHGVVQREVGLVWEEVSRGDASFGGVFEVDDRNLVFIKCVWGWVCLWRGSE